MAYNYEYPYTDPGLYNDDWLINKVKQLAAEWEDMKVKFTTLEEYVKNYFANLNLQDEVNEKIDQMISDGTFVSMISSRIRAGDYFGGILCIGNINNAGVQFPNLPNVQSYTTLGYLAANMANENVDYIFDDIHAYNGSMRERYLEYKSKNPNKHFRTVFAMFSPVDILQRSNVLSSEIIKLSSAIGEVRLVVIPPPFKTMNFTPADFQIYDSISQFVILNCYRPVLSLPIYLGGVNIVDSQYNVIPAYAHLYTDYLLSNLSSFPFRAPHSAYTYTDSYVTLYIEILNILDFNAYLASVTLRPKQAFDNVNIPLTIKFSYVVFKMHSLTGDLTCNINGSNFIINEHINFNNYTGLVYLRLTRPDTI